MFTETKIRELTKQLSNPDWKVRLNAARALRYAAEQGADINLKKVQETLKKFVNNAPFQERPEARREAGKCLQYIMNAMRGSGAPMEGILSDGILLPPHANGRMHRVLDLKRITY